MIENLKTYLWILFLTFAVLMVLIGVLRWIADPKKRKDRLTALSICAFVFLVIMFLGSNWETIRTILENNADTGELGVSSLIGISKISVKVLLIVFMVAFLFIIVFIAALLVIYCVKTIVHTIPNFEQEGVKELEDKLQKETEKINILLKTPVVIIGICGGILALYLIIPLVMGQNSQGLAMCWQDGVEKIVTVCTNKSNVGFASSLALYSLIFILIVGIGYGVINILFEIIQERFKKRTVFLKEYSTPIGLMAVGGSILLLISNFPNDLIGKSWSQVLLECSKPFLIVIFVIAIGILMLEIVRLLINMKEKMIRHEARYLFVLLVGLCTVIMMKAFLIVYNAINSVLGTENIQSDKTEDAIQKICDSILKKVVKDMEDGIEIHSSKNKDDKIPYNTFKGKITKK